MLSLFQPGVSLHSGLLTELTGTASVFTRGLRQWMLSVPHVQPLGPHSVTGFQFMFLLCIEHKVVKTETNLSTFHRRGLNCSEMWHKHITAHILAKLVLKCDRSNSQGQWDHHKHPGHKTTTNHFEQWGQPWSCNRWLAASPMGPPVSRPLVHLNPAPWWSVWENNREFQVLGLLHPCGNLEEASAT